MYTNDLYEHVNAGGYSRGKQPEQAESPDGRSDNKQVKNDKVPPVGQYPNQNAQPWQQNQRQVNMVPPPLPGGAPRYPGQPDSDPREQQRSSDVKAADQSMLPSEQANEGFKPQGYLDQPRYANPKQPGYLNPQGYPNQPGYPSSNQPGNSNAQGYTNQPGYPNPKGYPNQSGNLNPQGYPNQPGNLNPQGYPNQPGNPNPKGYPNQPGYPSQPGNSNPQGYPNQPGYPNPKGYPNQPGNLNPQGHPNQPGSPNLQEYLNQPLYPDQPGYPNSGYASSQENRNQRENDNVASASKSEKQDQLKYPESPLNPNRPPFPGSMKSQQPSQLDPLLNAKSGQSFGNPNSDPRFPNQIGDVPMPGGLPPSGNRPPFPSARSNP